MTAQNWDEEIEQLYLERDLERSEKIKDEYERLVTERMEATRIKFTPEDSDGKTR